MKTLAVLLSCYKQIHILPVISLQVSVENTAVFADIRNRTFMRILNGS